MYYIIYQITNQINHKIYIGKHQTPYLDDKYFGSGLLLKRAIEKYGKNNFTKEILFISKSEEEMNAKEKELVTEEFCQRDDNYNLCVGGQGGFSYINREGLNQYPARRGSAAIADHFKTRYNNDPVFREQIKTNGSYQLRKYREQGLNGFRGKKHTEATKLKMSDQRKITSKGERNSQFGTCWITDGKQNKKHRKTEPVPVGWNLGRKLKDIL